MKQYEKWMPLYIADYLADTSRLTLEQHGAYLLLIMDYWRNGAPPDDPEILARIVGASQKQWDAIASVLQRLFRVEGGQWRHKRIDEELARANKISNIRAAVAANRHANEHAKKVQLHTPSPSPLHRPSPEPSPTPKKQAHTDAAVRLLAELEVDQQLIKDWTAVRKAKRAGPITETVIKAMEREAGKAGIPVSEAVKICAERGWQGFKAAWMTDSPQARQQPPSQSLQAARNLDELSRKIRDGNPI